MPARIEPYGEDALLLRLDDGAEMGRQRRLEGIASAIRGEAEVREAVVGLGNLSVFVHRGARRAIAERLLERLAEAPANAEGEKTHEIPVRYDGEDLAEFAALRGLSIEESVALHLAPTYRVAFLGFAPGFAYLLGLDPRLAMPRRERPRTRVPAGAVAIGDAFTAVYPVASPGGWHIIGRTTSVLFDPQLEPPAMLAVGDAVRFVRQR